MKSLQQTLYEKLKIRPSKSDFNEFDVITLLEDVTNLLLKKSWPQEVQEKVQEFGTYIKDYKDLRVLYTCGSIDETYEIESITPSYKLKTVGKGKYFEVREIMGETNVIEFPKSYNNHMDEYLEISKDNSKLLYETGGEGNCIIINKSKIVL